MNKIQSHSTPLGHTEAEPRLKEIAAKIFHVDVADIDLAMGPDDISGWDSLNHLRLITEVESTFSLKLTMQQIQQIKSLADILKLIP